jgi:hypothetical protein
VAAAAVGAATLAASLRCGATLLAFYAASSRLTAFREQAKAVDESFKPGGQRDAVQVRVRVRVRVGHTEPSRTACRFCQAP